VLPAHWPINLCLLGSLDDSHVVEQQSLLRQLKKMLKLTQTKKLQQTARERQLQR
jgi:hypothetical protein